MCIMCLIYRIIHTINCYKEPVDTHIFFAPGDTPYQARALTAPPDGLFATFGGFDTPTLKMSLPFLISLAKMAKLLMIFCRKKQRTNAKSGGTKVADRLHVGA